MTTQSEPCPICLDPIKDKNQCSLECTHSFHYKCLFTWNKDHNSCPVCRDVIDKSKTETVKNIDNIDNIIISDFFNRVNQENYLALSREMIVSCKDCHSQQLYNCSGCDNVFCSCEWNHRTFKGRNPFEVHPDNWDTDPCTKHFCLDCVIERDQLVLEVLSEMFRTNGRRLQYNVCKKRLKDIYTQLYTSKTELDYFHYDIEESSRISTIPDIETFYDYIRESYYPEIPMNCLPRHDKDYEIWSENYTRQYDNWGTSIEEDMLQNFNEDSIREVLQYINDPRRHTSISQVLLSDAQLESV